MEDLKDLSSLVSLCKRRGFVFPSSEIYGGLNSCWDYGPLGADFKLNVKKSWWENMVSRRDVVGLDSSILMRSEVWKTSGHVDTFTDPLVDCKNCKNRFRKEEKCPRCGSKDMTEPRNFNLMFKTFMGPVEEDSSLVYLRPETAQGIFINFQNVSQSMRKKIPFGVAQIGKSFRNEITPGNFIFRTREFEQMEMQYFVEPGTEEKEFERWKQERMDHLKSMGLRQKKLQFYEHKKEELAHYAKKAFDIQYEFPFGFQEIEGVHNRGDFDLGEHQKVSGKNLKYQDAVQNKSYVPYVIETAVGCDRLCLALLADAYRKEKVEGEERISLRLSPELSPIKVAFLPLSKKPKLQELASKMHDEMSPFFRSDYDESSSIGKRYRRQDEIGTPFCVTVDFESLEDNKVTVRQRDSMKQERISIDQLKSFLANSLGKKN